MSAAAVSCRLLFQANSSSMRTIHVTLHNCDVRIHVAARMLGLHDPKPHSCLRYLRVVYFSALCRLPTCILSNSLRIIWQASDPVLATRLNRAALAVAHKVHMPRKAIPTFCMSLRNVQVRR